MGSVSEALFCTGCDTPFQGPSWGGLSLVPLITVIFLFLLFTWIFVCWCEENTGRHFKGFHFIKSIQHAKQITQGGNRM